MPYILKPNSKKYTDAHRALRDWDFGSDQDADDYLRTHNRNCLLGMVGFIGTALAGTILMVGNEYLTLTPGEQYFSPSTWGLTGWINAGLMTTHLISGTAMLACGYLAHKSSHIIDTAEIEFISNQYHTHGTH